MVPMLNGDDPEWAPSRMITIPNGHDPACLQPRMDKVLNEHLRLYFTWVLYTCCFVRTLLQKR